MNTDFERGIWGVFSNVERFSAPDIGDGFAETRKDSINSIFVLYSQLISPSYDLKQCSTVTCQFSFTTLGAITRTSEYLPTHALRNSDDRLFVADIAGI